MMYLIVLAVIISCMCLVFARALLGPTLYDRILAINSVGTKTVLFIALYGYFNQRPEFADIALLYALLNILGTIAVLKFIERSFPAQRYLDEEE